MQKKRLRRKSGRALGLFFHLFSEIHCRRLNERALFAGGEFVVVPGEHDNGAVHVSLRKNGGGRYRVAVYALNRVELKGSRRTTRVFRR